VRTSSHHNPRNHRSATRKITQDIIVAQVRCDVTQPQDLGRVATGKSFPGAPPRPASPGLHAPDGVPPNTVTGPGLEGRPVNHLGQVTIAHLPGHKPARGNLGVKHRCGIQVTRSREHRCVAPATRSCLRRRFVRPAAPARARGPARRQPSPWAQRRSGGRDTARCNSPARTTSGRHLTGHRPSACFRPRPPPESITSTRPRTAPRCGQRPGLADAPVAPYGQRDEHGEQAAGPGRGGSQRCRGAVERERAGGVGGDGDGVDCRERL
jgi:hypothetical protein